MDHLSTSGAGNGVDVDAFREPQEAVNRRLEYGPAEFDIAHRFIASAVWQIPTGKALPKALGYLARDWEFSPIVSAQTGLALTVAQAQLLNIGGERLIRPFIVAKGALAAGSRTVDN